MGVLMRQEGLGSSDFFISYRNQFEESPKSLDELLKDIDPESESGKVLMEVRKRAEELQLKSLREKLEQTKDHNDDDQVQ
jgi:hypothetical protein